ncbi:hypothetical protein MJ389_19515 [Escherichia coli]|nr:hypothetical protein MJ389_19515 [Escherichia coli]
MIVLTAVMVWVIWGVIVNAWFIPEIASQFFTMGLVIGIIGVVFRLNGMTVNTMASSFTGGANDDRPCPAGGFRQGILLLVGNGEAGDASVLNTILNSIANAISGLDNAVAARFYVFALRAVFNFFVTSGSGPGGVNHAVTGTAWRSGRC